MNKKTRQFIWGIMMLSYGSVLITVTVAHHHFVGDTWWNSITFGFGVYYFFSGYSKIANTI